jgi:uncharacterized oxidoreductase
MEMNGNTVLITGGGSGIGRALAEAFTALGNQVVIAGRRKEVLDEVTRANPGMRSAVLDIENATSIAEFAQKLTADVPSVNVVIHCAGIMRREDAKDGTTDVAEATIATNLLGPIRLNAALVDHLLGQPRAAILTVSSGLAFLPRASTITYSATKAAIHSYTESLRHQLKGSPVQVIEIVPPYVQTELMGAQQANDPHAMPLKDYIAETMKILGTDQGVKEVLVERVKPLRFAEVNGTYDAVFTRMNG